VNDGLQEEQKPTQQDKAKQVEQQTPDKSKMKKGPAKQVSFKPQPAVESATKVNMGKANIKRDLMILVAAVGCILLMASGMNDMGIPRGGKKTTFKDYFRLVSNRAEAQFQAKGGKSAPNCSMFLAQSSVPGAGHGVFAGRDYAEGDVVV
jgi:hypothetical protein